MDFDFFEELADTLDRVGEDGAKALIITGRPGYFSGGLDVKLMPALSPTELNRLAENLARNLLKVYSLPIPTVAVCSGHAIAGGAMLCFTCDLRFVIDGPYIIQMNEILSGIPFPSWMLFIGRSAIPVRWQVETFLHFVFFFFVSFFAWSAGENLWAGDIGGGQYKLIKQWETEKVLRIPESVLYHESGNILYVSNINGRPTQKNGQGFISKLSLDGKIRRLKWATGLNAPKGSAIFGGKLYVSDIDQLIEIDLKTGKILAGYPAAGAKFLNDVATDVSGNIYVTDMSSENSVIYRLVQGKMTAWVKGKEISNPNGLCMEKKRLVVGNSGDGSLKAINLAAKKINTLARVGSGIDGLRADGKGSYFISDWKGKTSLVTASGKIIVLMDTTASKINSADLEYVKSRRLLLIPTFFDNRVVAYRVEEVR